MVFRVPLPPALLLTAYGVFGGTGILSYAIAAEYFPTHMIGRAHTTLTLVIFVLIFCFQVGIGALLSFWPAEAGRYTRRRCIVGDITIWAILIGMQTASAIWYVLPSRVLQKQAGAVSSN